MPKTKTHNKTEVNKNGKELDDIVDYIIKKCNEVIEEYKSQEGRKVGKEHSISGWRIIIDNIPVYLYLQYGFDTNFKHEEILYLRRKIQWMGKMYLDDCVEEFNNKRTDIKVENDIIDKNDITRTIIDMFNFDNLKFCKIRNRFIEKDCIFLKTINYFNLKYQDADECCVCYDITTTKTKKCNHYLCLECVPKIKTFIPRNTLHYIDCPMCKQKVREIISNESHNVSDYEDVSDDEDE